MACAYDGGGVPPARMMSVRAASSGINHAPCASTMSASAPQAAHRLALRPETRTMMSNSTRARNSVLFSAVKTARLTSSATGRVIEGVPKRAGVAISETPTAMPTHVKQTHDGLSKALRIRCDTGI